eukprot:4035-Eustigmatos_ZCMA.PRE.1
MGVPSNPCISSRATCTAGCSSEERTSISDALTRAGPRGYVHGVTFADRTASHTRQAARHG